MQLHFKLFAGFLLTILSYSFLKVYSIPKDDKVLYTSMKSISCMMQKKYGFTGGFCGCGKNNGFWKVIFDFHKSISSPTLEISRILAVSCTEEVINLINQDEKIRFNLQRFPLSNFP